MIVKMQPQSMLVFFISVLLTSNLSTDKAVVGQLPKLTSKAAAVFTLGLIFPPIYLDVFGL